MNNSLKPLQDNLIFSENECLNFPFSMSESKDNEKGLELFNPINNFNPLPNYFQADLPQIKQVKFITAKNKTSFIISKKPKKVKENNNTSYSNGRWTKEERKKFAYGLWKYGTDWKKIKHLIATRSDIQLRSHAQKFLDKLKSNKDIKQKGLNIKNLLWKNAYKLIKESFNSTELLNLLNSIESELEDNKRMTTKYLERKEKMNKTKLGSSTEETNISLTSSEDNDSNNNEYLSIENNFNKTITLKENEYEAFQEFDNYQICNNLNEIIMFEKDKKLFDKYINIDNESSSFDNDAFNDNIKKVEEKRTNIIYLLP